MDAATPAVPASPAPVAAKPVKTKKLTLRQQLEVAQAQQLALETTLRDTTNALKESISREQQMVSHLQSRFYREMGEHPVDYARRVVGFISEQAAQHERERQEFLRKQAGYKAEIQMLNGQLNTLEGSLEGLVQVAKAGKKPAPTAPAGLDMEAPASPITRALDRILRQPGKSSSLFGVGY